MNNAEIEPIDILEHIVKKARAILKEKHGLDEVCLDKLQLPDSMVSELEIIDAIIDDTLFWAVRIVAIPPTA